MHKGFTLIELLAVVMIISILTAIAMPQYRKSMYRSRAAEARQMLPAIYDSCERFVQESLCTSWSSPDCKEAGQFKLSFNKLDMEMKGKAVAGQPLQWQTKNFLYTVDPIHAEVTAKWLAGRWTGVLISYDGDQFTCNPCNVSTGTKKKAEACEFLDFGSEVKTCGS